MVNVSSWIPDCNPHRPALSDLFLLTLAFVLQQPSLHCEILIMLLSQFPSTFFQTQKRMPLFIAQLMTSRLRNVLCDDIFKLCASVAAAEFLSGSRLELMYVSLIVNIMSSLTHLHGFQLLALLPQLIEITSLIFTNRINLLHLK